MATNAQMAAQINAGKAVEYRGTTIRTVAGLPTDAQITQDNADYSVVYVAPPRVSATGTGVRLLTGAGPYTVLATDDVILLPATPTTSGVINLPATSTLTVDKTLVIKAQGRNSLTLTLTANVADTGGIDGAATLVFTADNQAVTLVSDKTRAAWWVTTSAQAFV